MRGKFEEGEFFAGIYEGSAPGQEAFLGADVRAEIRRGDVILGFWFSRFSRDRRSR